MLEKKDPNQLLQQSINQNLSFVENNYNSNVMFFATAISHLLQIKSKSSIKWQTISLTKQTVKKHKQTTNPTRKCNSSKVRQRVIWINPGTAEFDLQTTSLSKKHQEIFPKPSPCPLFFFFPFFESFKSTGMTCYRSQKAEIQKRTQQSVLDKN